MHISHPAAKIYCLLVLWYALCRHKYVAGFVAISAPWEGSVKALKGGHFLQSFPPSARHPQPSQETVACVSLMWAVAFTSALRCLTVWSISGGLKTADADCRLHQRRQL